MYTEKQLAKANCSALREREKNITEVTVNSSCISSFYSIGHNLEFYSENLKKAVSPV